MPTVQDILMNKGKEVHHIAPASTVLDAIQQMNHHKIGALLVMDENRVAGIFTERDVLRRVLGEMKNPAEMKVDEAMTKNVICVEPDTDLDEVSAIFKDRRIRHLPVCDHAGRLYGMISIGDVNAFHVNSQEMTIQFLNEYIYGRA